MCSICLVSVQKHHPEFVGINHKCFHNQISNSWFRSIGPGGIIKLPLYIYKLISLMRCYWVRWQLSNGGSGRFQIFVSPFENQGCVVDMVSCSFWSYFSFFPVTEPRLYSRTEVGCFLEPPEGECEANKASQKNCIFFQPGLVRHGLMTPLQLMRQKGTFAERSETIFFSH